MASGRTTRASKKGINYAKLNSLGRESSRVEADNLEEGQIADSPLHIHTLGDEFGTEPRSRSSEGASVIDSQFGNDDVTEDGTELDYEEDGLSELTMIQQPGQEEQDVGKDEVWQ